ncbi:DUF6153 family protein [Streptomyces sp. NPDC008313]|uniref:DUF6153 family protein n=1 Tax=Streptomyces sp. NPDC008313 TaxID=3364826 RepID=UPI0036E58372
MPCAVRPPSRRPAGRGFVLLVLAVLAGVLAMHGLAPGPAPAKATVPGSAHAVTMAHEKGGQAAGDCFHAAGGPKHAHHADATCAASGVGAPYAPPPLASAPGIPLMAQVQSPGAAGAPEGGRAPPDLAELQLLRI